MSNPTSSKPQSQIEISGFSDNYPGYRGQIVNNQANISQAKRNSVGPIVENL